MVKVITIMDDVYADLYRLKRSKDMSFSEVLRFLLQERREEGRSIMHLAGSVTEFDVDRRAMDKMKKVYSFGRY